MKVDLRGKNSGGTIGMSIMHLLISPMLATFDENVNNIACFGKF